VTSQVSVANTKFTPNFLQLHLSAMWALKLKALPRGTTKFDVLVTTLSDATVEIVEG